jgi:hypothetical protein
MLKTVSSITNALGSLNYKGTWNASTNTPALASGAGTKGDYYVVSVAGTTSLDGISNWGVGDWATYNGSVWQRVEGGADLNGVNLSVSGTTNLAALTASTALALDSSKNVVSVTNTGTGNNVLATSPSITTPRVITSIDDTNGNELLRVTAVASAVNELTLANAATGGSPLLSTTGGDTDINLTITPKGAGRLDLIGSTPRTLRIGTNANGGSGDEFANLEFYWGDPDAAEVKAKLYAKNVGNVGPGGGGAADLIVATTPAFGALTERFRWTADGKVLSLPIYNTTVGATNRDVFVDNTGLIGYVSSTRESKANITEMSDVSWLSALQPVTFNRRKKEPVLGGDDGTVVVGEQYSSEHYDELEYGLIADEAETVNPELCFYDMVDGVKVLRGIHYSKLIVPLLKRVQQQNTEIQAIKAEIANLKGV